MSCSAFRRERVVSVAIALSDASVFAMDEDLGLLVDCDLARCPLCFGLSIVVRSVALITFTANGPTVFAGHYMLILTHDFAFLNGCRFRHKASLMRFQFHCQIFICLTQHKYRSVRYSEFSGEVIGKLLYCQVGYILFVIVVYFERYDFFLRSDMCLRH